LRYIVKSLKSNEIYLEFSDKNNMRLIFEERDEFLDLLKLRFITFCPKIHLKVYGIPLDTLKDYKASSSQYAFDNEPDDMYRLYNEEIQTQSEVQKKEEKKVDHSIIS